MIPLYNLLNRIYDFDTASLNAQQFHWPTNYEKIKKGTFYVHLRLASETNEH